MRFIKGLGYFGGSVAFLGLIWSIVFTGLGLIMVALGTIIMLITLLFEEE